MPNTVNPVLQGEGPLLMDGDRPLSRISNSCGGAQSSKLLEGASPNEAWEVHGRILTHYPTLGSEASCGRRRPTCT